MGAPALTPSAALAALPPCGCAFDFEDGSTQGWQVTSGSGLTVSNSTNRAYTGSRSLAVTARGSGAVAVNDASALAGLTNGTTVTYRVYSPRKGDTRVQPFTTDRSLAVHTAEARTLGKGWTTLTWQVPYQSGVTALGLKITPLLRNLSTLNLDALSWPDTFVRRAATRLQVGGQDYRFDGINIYNANSLDNCWYRMGDNDLLNQTLSGLSGLEVFRSWFFQSLATRNGVRDWSAFDHTLQVAADHHVKVIVTLGNQWGDCESTGYKDLGWYQTRYLQQQGGELVSYRAWVQEAISRYRNDPTIAMWQLMNEAEASDSRYGNCQETSAASALRAFTDDVGGLAHSLDSRHLVNLGTLGSGQCGTANANYQYLHSSAGTDLCEFHDYGSPSVPMPGDEWNGLQVRLNQCNTNLGKPLFGGETGISIPDEVATQSERASAFDAKLAAQFTAGVVGELLWALNSNCSNDCTTYDIGPGDPSLALLSRY